VLLPRQRSKLARRTHDALQIARNCRWSPFFYAIGIFLFWLGGCGRPRSNKKAAHAQAKTVTPAQMHA
jgi:hypothetical protein